MSEIRLTRRALIAAAAVAQAAEKAGDPVRLPRQVRLGLIGFDGHPGEVLGQLGRLPDVKFVAYAIDGTDPLELRQVLNNPAVRNTRRYEEFGPMLEHEKLDLVAVCNNDGRRARAILACGAKGLHVIAEKPLAISRPDLAAIKKVYSKPGLRIGCLLPMRFSPPYQALKNIVASGQIGEILQITGQKSYNLGKRPEWERRRESYGSTVYWIGPHMIDLMRYCSGRELVEVAGYQAHVAYPELGDMENVTAAVYKLDNGGVANLHMDFLRPDPAPGHGDDRLRLAGTKGVVEYMAALGVVVMNSQKEPFKLAQLPPGRSVFIDFLESVYLDRPSMLPLSDIYRVNEIAIATDEASRQHRFLKT